MHRLILIGILVIAALVRLTYIDYSGGSIILMPDSQGYYTTYHFFNPHRTPAYFMLASLAMTVTGQGHPPYMSPDFYDGTGLIIFIQTIIGLMSLIVLYDTLLAVRISRAFSLAFTGFTALNIYQFIWDRAFLTESLYISLFIIIMRLFVKLLGKPTLRTGLVFTALAAYEFLLRPAGLMLPYLLLPLLWIVHKTKRVFILIMILLCLYTIVPAGFIAMNRHMNGFRGIGYNSDFGVFGRILLYKSIPIDTAASVTDLYQKVKGYRDSGANVSIPWYFFVLYNDEIYGRLAELQEFNRLVIKGHFWEFMKTVIADIPKAFFDTEVYDVLYRSSTPSITRSFFEILNWIIRLIQKSTIVFLLLFPYSAWIFLRKQTIPHAFLFGIGLVEIYQLFSSLIFGGSWEFARHMITTQTYLFLFCFWWIGRIISWIKKRI